MKKKMIAVLLTACMLVELVQTDVSILAEEVTPAVTETESTELAGESIETEDTEDIGTDEPEETEAIENVQETEEVSDGGSVTGETERQTDEQETDDEQETEAQQEKVIMRPTEGLMQFDIIDVGEVPESEIFDISDIESDEIQITVGSGVYSSTGDSYSNNYIYNMLSEDERTFWDAMDAACLQLLVSTDDAEYYSASGTYYMPYVSYGSISETDAKYLAYMFRYSNPQYYFLNTTLLRGYTATDKYVAFGIYSAFADGTARATATRQVKTQADAWVATANKCADDEEKVKVLHDLVVDNVEYNNDFGTSSFDEDTAYSQSAYSVFCTDKTVCAGYAQAFEMICNVAGIDCFAVTSSNHEWNKVRINDSWYNVDCTWADQSSWIYYEYFERSDAVYDSDASYYANSHAEVSFWNEYLPLCTLDSGASGVNAGSLPAITTTTAAPVITSVANGGAYDISITSATVGAIIYYTTDGTVPSPSYTRSYRYDSTFKVNNSCTIRAVAVCDTRWDSSVVSKDFTVTPTVYTLSFHGNGGIGSVSSQKFVKGQVVTLPSGNGFKRSGYTFSGWNTAANGTGTAYSAGQSITIPWAANKTLYAQWVSNTSSSVLTGKQKFVALLYENVLERTASQSEINYWVAKINGGQTGASVAYGFLFSDEFQKKNLGDRDYIERLYRSMMGRASDASGKNYWAEHLANGVSRLYVFRQFVVSNEFSNLCSTYGINRGDVSLTEARDINYNVTRFVTRNYLEFLGRSYEVDGLNYWCRYINGGGEMQQMAYGFVFSGECKGKNLSDKAFVQMLYRGLMDREGENAGVIYWTGRLNSGAMSREEVFWGFANSQEFSNLVKSYGL